MMVSLNDISEITMGQSPSSDSYNNEQKGIPFYQGNADFGAIHPTPRVWCDAPKKTANEGDILISVRAPIGALNIANEHCCIGRGLAAITVNEDKCKREYLWQVLNTKTDELNARGTGSTFKAIGKKQLQELQIPLPAFDEQAEIAEELSQMDHCIRICKGISFNLDELVKSRHVGEMEVAA